MKKIEPNYLFYFAAIAAILTVTTMYFMMIIFALFPIEKKANEFGDAFGVANAAFSGLAFVGVIIAIWMQMIELSETRDVVKKQNEQATIQSKIFDRQLFESSFFQLLSLQQELVTGIDIEVTPDRAVESEPLRPVTVTGRDCFFDFYKCLKAWVSSARENAPNLGERLILTEAYFKTYSFFESNLGHYFRHLYTVIKFVDEANCLNQIEKRRYTNIVRAQLSSNELLMLFYNCSSGLGLEKFKLLVERYSLLKNLDRRKLISESHRDWFDITAFINYGPFR